METPARRCVPGPATLYNAAARRLPGRLSYVAMPPPVSPSPASAEME